MGRWQRYWFAEGGRTAAAVVRMALAAAVLMTLWRIATLSTVQLPGPRELYRPVGIWMLLGRIVPPDPVIDALWVLAWAATGAMLIGLFSRLTTAISCGAALALVSLSFASSAGWSHQYNVVFLAQIAFLGARGGDTLSVDALIRRWRKLPPIDVPRGYQWSLRLVQLAVALMFAGAAFHKIMHGHFTLRWALSDNLRNQLLVRYDLADLPRPPLVEWMIDNVWRYRTAAVLNLISQTMPILACLFVRRPWVRAIAGGFFALEVVALDLVVGLWNAHWMPLAAVFVDWDRLTAWVTRRPITVPAVPATWQPRRATRIFLVAFVVYDAITAFVPVVDQVLNTYPFSGFPMFAMVRARAPYDEHQPYAVIGDHFEALSDRPLDERSQRWLDHHNRRLESVRDPKRLRAKLTAILKDAQARFPEFGIRGMRHYVVVFESPAYPAPARFTEYKMGITGEIGRDGVFRTALGVLDDTGVELRPQGLDTSGARLLLFPENAVTPQELPAERRGDRFLTGPIPGERLHIVAAINGDHWLVASRRLWRWE